MEAAEIGSWTIHVEIGRGGVDPGGGILVDLPKEWLSLRNPLSKPVQLDAPSAPHYLGAESSRPGAQLAVRSDRLDFDSIYGRFPHVVDIMVMGAPLRAGDEIRLRFANTTAPFLAGEDEVRVAVDARGYGEYALMAHGARYRVASGAPRHLLLVAPSDVEVGRGTTVRVSVLDRFHNPVPTATGRLIVRGLGGEPLRVRLAAGTGSVEVPWTPARAGMLWPTASFQPAAQGRRGAPLRVAGNPVRAHSSPPRQRVFWGDIHSHSTISKDAIGHLDFEYARDVTHLDFFASTEHADDDRPHAVERNGITAREWNHVRHRVREFDRPGRFATLLAYECNLLDGHRCVYYRTEDGVPWPPHQLGHKAEKLWMRLERGNAFGIPHHMGRGTHLGIRQILGSGLEDIVFADDGSSRGEIIDWNRPQPEDLQPALEIYSSHGTSEGFDPDDALAYEKVRFLPSSSVPGAHYAWNAWAQGHRAGVVAASDNHTGQPGLPHTGLTAVLAPELSREAVFDAIAARRTYATTGERILLDFALNGSSMGESVAAAATIAGSVFVAAPREIRFAEVLEVRSGDPTPHPVARWEFPGKLLEAEFEAPASGARAAVYLRCELEGTTGGRVARAWSSPIFVVPPVADASQAGVAAP